MKKAIIAAALITAIAASGAFADWRLDVGADIPVYVGVTTADLDEDLSAAMQWLILFPNATISYDFALGPLSLGLGAKLYTLIIESLVYPVAYAELDFDPIIINLTAGGFGFAIFGLYSATASGAIVIPDLSVMFKLGKVARLGVGAMTALGTDITQDAFPYVVYATAKFKIPL